MTKIFISFLLLLLSLIKTQKLYKIQAMKSEIFKSEEEGA